MEEITCPNCNVDVDTDELKRNHLRCPTCGHDLSDAEDKDDFDDEDDEEEVDEKKKAEDEDEDEE